MSGPEQGAIEQSSEPREPGFCSATCVDRNSLKDEIKKDEPKTSDVFVTCNLPKRFEHPRKFILIRYRITRPHQVSTGTIRD